MIRVVVVLAEPRLFERRRLPALAGREEPDRIDFVAIRTRRIRPAHDVVRDRVVVDEHHAGADGSLHLARVHTAR